MRTKHVVTEVDIDVDIDLEDFDTDELIAEIESRTGRFMIDNEDAGSISEAAKDEIYAFYQNYILWKDCGMKNESFEQIANKFFEDNLGILVH